MGGRGMLSGTAKYGDEFKGIAMFQTSRGEVKIIASKISKSNKRPYITQTENRIYATLSKDGEINNLYFFGPDGKITEEWNLNHTHNGIKEHKHAGFEHDSSNAVPLSESDLEYLEEVRGKWRL